MSHTAATLEEALDILREEAGAFLRAGGVLRWVEWKQMAPETKKAFRDAQDEYKADQLRAAIAHISDEITAGLKEYKVKAALDAMSAQLEATA